MRNLLKTDPEAERDTSRLEAFSDGVIAIAITLLVLEIHVPQVEDGSAEALWQALRDLWPSYLGYLISFLTVGVMWANHHLMFRYINRADHYLKLTNLLLLFLMALIPFPTALMADYLGQPAQQVGVVVYSGIFFACALAFNLVWWYAAHEGRLIDPEASQAIVDEITKRFRLGPPGYGLAFVLAFVNTTASLIVLLLLTLEYTLPYRTFNR